MGWWGRGGEPAQPNWAVGCPVSRPPSHCSSWPHAAGGGVFLPHMLSPVLKGSQAGLSTDPWQPRIGRVRGGRTAVGGRSG